MALLVHIKLAPSRHKSPAAIVGSQPIMLAMIAQESLTDLAREAINGAQEVLDRLEASISLTGKALHETAFYTRGRVKSIESLVEKIADRQNRYQTQYSLADVTDIVGFRIVVLYDDQIKKGFDLAVQTMRNCFNVSHPLFMGAAIWDSVSEVKFFPRSEKEQDVYRICEKHVREVVPSEHHNKIKVAPSDAIYYSSMHIICNAVVRTLGYDKVVPVEIQIRTAIEDIWAEVSHKNSYKLKNKKAWTPAIQEKYDYADEAIKNLKASMDGIPGWIESLRRNTIGLAGLIDQLKRPEPAYSFSAIIDLAHVLAEGQISLPARRLIERYERAIKSLFRVKTTRPERGVIIAECLGTVAKLIEAMGSSVRDAVCKEQIVNLLQFELLRLELIKVQRFSPEFDNNKEEQFRRLSELYFKIDRLERENNWRFRLDTLFNYWKYYALVQNNINVDPMYYLRASYEALRTDPLVPEDSMIRVIVPRNLAFRFWEDARKDHEALEKFKGYKGEYLENTKIKMLKALEISLEATRTDPSRGDLVYGVNQWERLIDKNNILYYSLECFKHGSGEYALSRFGITEQYLVRSAIELEKYDYENKMSNTDTRQRILDTIASIYEYYSDAARAKQVRLRLQRIKEL